MMPGSSQKKQTFEFNGVSVERDLRVNFGGGGLRFSEISELSHGVGLFDACLIALCSLKII